VPEDNKLYEFSAARTPTSSPKDRKIMSQLTHRPIRASALAVIALVAVLAINVYPAQGTNTDINNGLGAREQFIGSWRLVSFEARTAEGQVIYPFGIDAEGAVTITRDGRVWATIWRANRQPFAINDQQLGTPEEYTAAVQSYISIVGDFDVNPSEGIFSYVVEQSIFPNWNGTTQTRFYSFSDQGRTMELTTAPTPFGGTTIVGALVWERT
jgi:Lipocalin-like domain